jgi:hypothetical protein
MVQRIRVRRNPSRGARTVRLAARLPEVQRSEKCQSSYG